jgi:ribosomal protein L31E
LKRKCAKPSAKAGRIWQQAKKMVKTFVGSKNMKIENEEATQKKINENLWEYYFEFKLNSKML